MSTELVMPANHLILCRPLLVLPQSSEPVYEVSDGDRRTECQSRPLLGSCVTVTKLLPLSGCCFLLCLKKTRRDFPGGPVIKLHAPDTGGLGSIPGQGTRCHMPQLRVPTTKILHGQINKLRKKKQGAGQ